MAETSANVARIVGWIPAGEGFYYEERMNEASNYNECIYGKQIARLRAMVADGQKAWDLSPKDVEAIKLAVDVLETITIADDQYEGDIETHPMNSEDTPKLLWLGIAPDREYYGQTSLDCFVIAGRDLRESKT